MEKYKHPPLPPKDLPACRRRKPLADEEDGGRFRPSKKMRLDTEKENGNNINTNDSSNSNSSSFQQGYGFSRRSRSPRTGGLDPVTSNSHKTLLTNLPPPKGKVVNWRLACFMAREYLSKGTLLGKPWPPQDSNPRRGDETAKEKEHLYSAVTNEFFLSDDVHIPGILNPSHLVAWLGFK